MTAKDALARGGRDDLLREAGVEYETSICSGPFYGALPASHILCTRASVEDLAQRLAKAEDSQGLNEACAARDAVLARLKPGERHSIADVADELERRADLRNRIASLEASNRALSEDAARLDAIASGEVEVESMGTTEPYQIVYGNRHMFCASPAASPPMDLRGAIDAARKALLAPPPVKAAVEDPQPPRASASREVSEDTERLDLIEELLASGALHNGDYLEVPSPYALTYCEGTVQRLAPFSTLRAAADFLRANRDFVASGGTKARSGACEHGFPFGGTGCEQCDKETLSSGYGAEE